ncbi:hypothetical protein NQ176_g5624 [Zarea fungicola]|uniref:Uncharacterized protein n=1 Tax=Zarea fungicola TaxID=93591 RepID=A0ACC1N8P8_9HYPO|nr:hypothetical protein NQ176_g5624 [Lecanicillium fungicola]
MPSKTKSPATVEQNRESQRRSRARRKNLIESLSQEVAEYKRQGVAASVEMQNAARAVSIENQRLRELLALRGVSQAEILQYLALPRQEAPTVIARARSIPKVAASPRNPPSRTRTPPPPSSLLYHHHRQVQVVMETGFAVTGFLAVILNLMIPEEKADESGVAHEEHASGLPKSVKSS